MTKKSDPTREYPKSPLLVVITKIEKAFPYLLDVVVGQGAAILELLAGEDQALLVRGNALLVLDLGLDVVDGVARLDLEGDGLTRQGLDETISRRISPCPNFLLVGSRRSEVVRGFMMTYGFRMTYICTGKARKKTMLAW